MKKSKIYIVIATIVTFAMFVGLLFVLSKDSADTNAQNPEPTVPTTAQIETVVEATEIIEEQSNETEEVATEETITTEIEIVIPNDDELVDISTYITGIVVDLKYATTDNFTGQQIYNSDQKAMLRYGTIKKLKKAQEILNDLGYTIVIWDAYRPTYAQFKLWEVCPNSTYVANPTNGGFSSHSRGNTVDITIRKLDGTVVEMPTEFDVFSQLADRNYSDVSNTAAEHATLLENIMIECGFKPYSGEWWHFSDTTVYDAIIEEQ